MQYHDMEVEARDYKREKAEDGTWVGRFTVRVLDSQDGETTAGEDVPVSYDYRQLKDDLGKLERRGLDKEGLIQLGRALAMLLLPPGEEGAATGVRELFADRLQGVGEEGGVRLWLRLPPELAAIPWEYCYVDRAGGGEGMDGFLALDPRVSIVRHEALPLPAPEPAGTGPIKVLAVLAKNLDLPQLDLEREKAILDKTLGEQEGIELDVLKDATLNELQGALTGGAAVFHFAGHGTFTKEIPGLPDDMSGVGALALEDETINAEALGINLRGNGVRLALLGGCETGRRGADGSNVWGGVAPALVKAEVPAVVANQYRIKDKCAIAFVEQFYRALVGGLNLDRAVAAGRIAAYNADRDGRDWGVPVFYLRAAGSQLFAGAADEDVRRQARAAAEADVNVRVREVAAGGKVLGARVGQMLSGKLGVAIAVSGTVYGKVTGEKAESIRGGSTRIDMEIDTVGKGAEVIGFDVDELGS